jgi:hypothetical protein
MYLWNGPGHAVPFHITYGFILLLHGDVVHRGGNPIHVDHYIYIANKIENMMIKVFG